MVGVCVMTNAAKGRICRERTQSLLVDARHLFPMYRSGSIDYTCKLLYASLSRREALQCVHSRDRLRVLDSLREVTVETQVNFMA
jgi:hypothetical protein